MRSETRSPIQPLPIPLFAACDHIRNAVRQHVLAEYSFPREAANAVVSLHVATELMLSWFTRQDRKCQIRAHKLISNYSHWSDEEKEQAHDIRIARNTILHRGELEPEIKEVISTLLGSYLKQIGKLCIHLEIPLEQEFRGYELVVLGHKEECWKIESVYKASTAKTYWHVDPEAAVELANAAFDFAYRHYADAWNIPGAFTRPIPDIFDSLLGIDMGDAAGNFYSHNDEAYDSYKFVGEDIMEWFIPPMNLPMLDEILGDKYSIDLKAEKYTNEIYDYVAFLVKDPPNIKFRDCLLKALPIISKKIAELYPGSLEVVLDLQSSIDHLRFTKRDDALRFMAHNRPEFHTWGYSYPCDYWQGEVLDYFEELLYQHCGEIPVRIDRYKKPLESVDGEEPNWFVPD